MQVQVSGKLNEKTEAKDLKPRDLFVFNGALWMVSQRVDFSGRHVAMCVGSLADLPTKPEIGGTMNLEQDMKVALVTADKDMIHVSAVER